MLNAYSTILLVIFLLVLIVLIVSALCAKRRKAIQFNMKKRKQDGRWMAGKRASSKAYYIQHNKRMKTQARIAYKINRKNKLATANVLSKLVHALIPESIKAKCRTWYNNNKASKQVKSRRYSKLKYSLNPGAKKKRAREHSAVTYSQNPESIKNRARQCLAVTYSQNPEPIKVLSAEFYFHKPITVHLELYLFYSFIHFLLYIGQY